MDFLIVDFRLSIQKASVQSTISHHKINNS